MVTRMEQRPEAEPQAAREPGVTPEASGASAPASASGSAISPGGLGRFVAAIGGTVVGTASLAAAFYVLGGRAGEATTAGHPAANVVGLPLAAAKQELRAGGPVRIRVDKVPFGQSGIVQRMLGFEFDGTINS